MNLFIRNLPRLSVDIDLKYLPRGVPCGIADGCGRAMKRIALRLCKALGEATRTDMQVDGAVVKLIVRHADSQIRIEVTPVLRGSVCAPELRAVRPAVEAAFGFAEMRLVSFADLYAGKIVAALDRQHPRDQFTNASDTPSFRPVSMDRPRLLR